MIPVRRRPCDSPVGKLGGTDVSQTVLAAQMYTVRLFIREFTNNAAGIAEAMKRIRAIGYEAVQVSGIGPIGGAELRKISDGEGLTICATHVDFDELLKNTAAQIDYHNAIGCKNVAIGGMPVASRENARTVKEFARNAEEVGRLLAAAGLTFSYHNHSFEFRKLDGRLMLDMVFGETTAKHFKAELDTYWVQHGGGDPAEWIRKLGDRMVLLHLKDMIMGPEKQLFAEIGEGNMNWPAILKAARDANVRWYIVEQDVCQRDPFESLGISFRNLKAMGLQ